MLGAELLLHTENSFISIYKITKLA